MKYFLESEEGKGIEVTILSKEHHLANKRRRSFRAGSPWMGYDLKTYAKSGACYSCGNENTKSAFVEDDDECGDVYLVCTVEHCDGNLFPEFLYMYDPY